MEWQRTASSDTITRQYLDSLLLEVRHLDAVLPEISFSCFGKTFSAPLTTGALSHLHQVCNQGMQQMAQGAAMAGVIAFSGMGPCEELAQMVDTGASVIKIIKTYQDRDLILQKVKHAESCGAMAVGMDIDHAFNPFEGFDCIDGREMRPLTTSELKAFVRSTSLPFVIKGVLSIRDAVKCKEAGVQGIVVSHHNGRLDYSVPALMMLPEIRKAVGDEMMIFVDGAIETGTDVLKALALGADACSIGRPLMPRLGERGAAGVADYFSMLRQGLSYAMSMTGCGSLREISADLIHHRSF